MMQVRINKKVSVAIDTSEQMSHQVWLYLCLVYTFIGTCWRSKYFCSFSSLVCSCLNDSLAKIPLKLLHVWGIGYLMNMYYLSMFSTECRVRCSVLVKGTTVNLTRLWKWLCRCTIRVTWHMKITYEPPIDLYIYIYIYIYIKYNLCVCLKITSYIVRVINKVSFM